MFVMVGWDDDAGMSLWMDSIKRRIRALQFLADRAAGYRVVWVDCGANVGEVLERQMEWFPMREYFAFEANPDLLPQLRQVGARHPKVWLDIRHTAVWTEDGHRSFYLSGQNESGRDDTEGSTLLEGKTPRNPQCGEIAYETPVTVPTVNLGAWLLREFRRGDRIWLKMDIEGAEYEVLDSMLRDGSLDLIDKAFVEFHYGPYHRIPGVDETRHRRILREVASRTRLVNWQ